jgi:hypothetical protein
MYSEVILSNFKLFSIVQVAFCSAVADRKRNDIKLFGGYGFSAQVRSTRTPRYNQSPCITVNMFLRKPTSSISVS